MKIMLRCTSVQLGIENSRVCFASVDALTDNADAITGYRHFLDITTDNDTAKGYTPGEWYAVDIELANA